MRQVLEVSARMSGACSASAPWVMLRVHHGVVRTVAVSEQRPGPSSLSASLVAIEDGHRVLRPAPSAEVIDDAGHRVVPTSRVGPHVGPACPTRAGVQQGYRRLVSVQHAAIEHKALGQHVQRLQRRAHPACPGCATSIIGSVNCSATAIGPRPRTPSACSAAHRLRVLVAKRRQHLDQCRRHGRAPLCYDLKQLFVGSEGTWPSSRPPWSSSWRCPAHPPWRLQRCNARPPRWPFWERPRRFRPSRHRV